MLWFGLRTTTLAGSKTFNATSPSNPPLYELNGRARWTASVEWSSGRSRRSCPGDQGEPGNRGIGRCTRVTDLVPPQQGHHHPPHHTESRFRLFAYQGRFTGWWLCPRLSVCTDPYLSVVQPRRSAGVRASASSPRTAGGFGLGYPRPLGMGSRYKNRAFLRIAPRKDSLGDCRIVGRRYLLFLMTVRFARLFDNKAGSGVAER